MRRTVSDALQDLRFGLRILRRSPVFTIVAVSSLALGIGGSAAVFALLNAIVLRNLPIAEPERFFVATRYHADETSPRFSWPSVERLRDELAGRAELAASSSMVGAISLLTVGLIAAYLPAFRASRIEPMTALARG